MSWPNEEQKDFLKSRAQAWEDSNGDPSAQTKFWDQLHRDWAERWLPRRGMDNSFSRYFREEMQNRRAIARGAAPKPATRRWVPKMSAPTLSELEHRRARGAPSSSPEYFSTPDHSPSRAQSPRHDESPTSPTAGNPHPPTPHADDESPTSPTAGDPHLPTPHADVSSAVASSSQTPAVLPPA